MSLKERANKVVEIFTQNVTVTESQKKLFNIVMDNIRSFSTGKSKKKRIGIVAIDLSLLYVDQRYQGLRTHKKLKNLINNWDESKLAPIVVVPHPEECRFAVVDGQGRLLAAKALGYDALYAIVLLDAPEDPVERLKFEAIFFITQDEGTEDVKPLQKHPARVIIGDEAALALENMFNHYDISYTDTKGSREAGVLGSYPTTYDIAKRHGESCLEFIFSIIHNAGWDKEPNGYATFVIESLKSVWTSFQKPSDRNRIYEYLSKFLRGIDPTQFSSDARSAYPMRKDTRIICTLYLEDLLANNLGMKKIA